MSGERAAVVNGYGEFTGQPTVSFERGRTEFPVETAQLVISAPCVLAHSVIIATFEAPEGEPHVLGLVRKSGEGFTINISGGEAPSECFINWLVFN